MCGIAAMLLEPKHRSLSELKNIKKLITENILVNEERGKEATGIALVQQDGEFYMEKMASKASDFVKSEAYFRLLEKINDKTISILGHTRKPTKGDVLCSHNNHPILSGSVIGIHNGHINNDDELFAMCNCKRNGQVDSEIIFQILNKYGAEGFTQENIEILMHSMKVMEGKYTFLAVTKRSPEKLLVVKHSNPLSMYYEPNWRALVFSSRYIFLRKTFGEGVVSQEIKNDKILLFDANLLTELKHNALASVDLISPGPVIEKSKIAKKTGCKKL